MKPFICTPAIVLVLFISTNLQGQHIRHDIRNIIDTVVLKAKHTSLHGHLVKWDSIRSEMHKMALHAKTVRDLKPCLEMLLNTMNDQYGQFLDAHNHSPIATFTDWSKISKDSTSKEVKTLPVKDHAKFEWRILERGVGYVKFVSISPTADVQKEAELIRSAVDSLGKDMLQKWIIDLRYLDGGSFNPVISGIAPLLGEGQIGGTADGRNKIRKLFEIHNGNFYDDQRLVAKFPSALNLHDSKVAVLISKYTAGPGEIVAITFKERKNTKFFGEPTRGNLIATNWIPINKSLIMSISESLYQDRLGHIYRGRLSPDVVVDFEPNQDIKRDKAISMATDWLKESNPEEQLDVPQIVKGGD